jgi:long-chain-fatty-acid--[acyl-carrier-protein] ligase
MLFTSGSESLPKAVSLTHKNLISDIVWALYHFPLAKKDILIGFLPPFHSFWFTINTIMPLISWLRVTYIPDPNDSKTIANLIKHTQTTAVTATPTFLKMILSVASKDLLSSLNYAVVWAEKCPESLAENFSKYCPNGKILEWYGITECSPVISINPPSKAKLGSVWLAIKWSDIKILSLEDQSILEANKEWMIYYAWDNVFSWYLDENLESPFDEIIINNPSQPSLENGRSIKYYKTWDLWYLDEDWYLYITWRLKRFVKIAWEMISLPFVEWILNKKYWSDIENKIAIEAIEEKWNVKIVLFTVDYLILEEVSAYLRENWVSNLVKISEIIKVDIIPVLWTWKTDYKVLKAMIKF